MSVSPKASTSTTPQKDHLDPCEHAHALNSETASFDGVSNGGVGGGGVMVVGCSDDEDDEAYDDELDENEVIGDDDDDDDDEIYSDLYNQASSHRSAGGGGGGDLDDKANNSEQSGELVGMIGGEEIFAGYSHTNNINNNGGEDDEDATSHSTEITLLGVSSSQSQFDKPMPDASPSLLKKLSKLPKKISVNAVTSTEKKLAKLAIVGHHGDGNSKYFKKFKFKRGNKSDETSKSVKVSSIF